MLFRIAVGVALEVDGAVGARGQAFDEAIELFGGDVAGRDGSVVGGGDVVEGGTEGVRGDGDEESAIGGALDGATAVVEEELARECGGEA